MAQHVDEVDYHNVEVVLFYLIELSEESFGCRRVVYLVVGERVVTAVSFYLCPHKRFLVEVLALCLVFIHPQMWEHFGNLCRHQAAENGVAGILCDSGKDAEIGVFFDVEHVAYFLSEHPPLVVTEVVNHYQKHLFTL